MAPSYDLAVSMLLCVEDNSCILSFDDDNAGDGGDERERCHFLGNPLVDLPPQPDDCMVFLVERETEHMPREDYAERLRTGALDLSIRRDAINWIMKDPNNLQWIIKYVLDPSDLLSNVVHGHYNFGPLSAYLSVNYLDRFLSNYELPKGKDWMTQLLAVACLSLAAKMEECEVPLSLDLQIDESKYIFEAKAIQRMELLILSTLHWRMQAVTPFSFIHSFIHKFSDANVPAQVVVSRSVELILGVIGGTDFLAFRSSEIASAVSLLVLGEMQTVDVEKALSCFTQVAREKVFRCYEMIKDMELTRSRKTLKNGKVSFSSVPQSPIGILDAACLTYKSAVTAAESLAARHHNSSAGSKRRKMSRS